MLITLAGFFVILVLTTFAQYSCRDLVRRNSTEPSTNWRRLSREAAGRFTNSTCPTATRMGFTTADRYVRPPLSARGSAATSPTPPALSQPSAPSFPSLQLLGKQAVRTGIPRSESRWFVLLLLEGSRTLRADSSGSRSLCHSQNRCARGLLQNLLTLSAPRPNPAPCT